MKYIYLFIIIYYTFLSCSGGDTKKIFLPEFRIVSCKFFPDTDECVTYNTGSIICNIGICQEGDCINGAGVKKFKNNWNLIYLMYILHINRRHIRLYEYSRIYILFIIICIKSKRNEREPNIN